MITSRYLLGLVDFKTNKIYRQTFKWSMRGDQLTGFWLEKLWLQFGTDPAFSTGMFNVLHAEWQVLLSDKVIKP